MRFEIGGRAVGDGAPTFVIAEIGLNHDGDVGRALQLVDAAAFAGASAIKLQTLQADRLVAPSCPAPAHVAAASLREFFAAFELDLDAHRAIVARARARGLAVLSTPFSLEAVPMLDALGIDAFKIASGDITFDGLIAAAAATGRPLIISTGMSTLEEAEHALDVARRAGAAHVAMLHCVSAYPAPAESQNLLALRTLADCLQGPVGLSDHGSDGMVSAIAAAVLGAGIYERHLMLDHTPDVIDHAVSSTPAQLKAIVAAMARTRASLGDGQKIVQPAEAANLVASRRGLYAARALPAGHRITAADVVALRPFNGLPPAALPLLLNTVVPRDIAAGTSLFVKDIALSRAS
jgi:N-acetylneuraminate synthase/N,N'-diacetyllegionaminate synthase